MTTLPRYLELVRVSSAGQAERETPEDQRRALDALRKSRPGVFVARLDSTVSGARNDRADLARLFELAAARAFDEVRVRHVDRLTRHPDPRQRMAVLGALIDASAVVVETGGRVIDPADEMGELDLTLQGWMAARERKRIAERTKAGRERKAAAGRLACGFAPYGRTWDAQAGSWGVDRERMGIYRRLFDLCLSGESLARIAALVADAPGPGRGEWSAKRVHHLLHDPAAVGVYRSHGHEFRIPPVVDEETQRAALARLKANHTLSGPPVRVFALLRKRIVCAECDAAMYVIPSPPSPHRYYVCSSRSHRRRWHRVDLVDREAQRVLSEWLEHPESLRAAALLEDDDAATAARREAREHLKAIDREEDVNLGAYRRGMSSKRAFEVAAREILGRRRIWEAHLATADAALHSQAARAQLAGSVARTIAALKWGLRSASPAKWRELVDMLQARAHMPRDGRFVLTGIVPIEPSTDSRRNSWINGIPLRLAARGGAR